MLVERNYWVEEHTTGGRPPPD